MNRHDAALSIIDPGACNPSGIALAIVAACAEIRAEGGGTDVIRSDSAVRLMVNQIAFLCGMVEMSPEDWATCRRVCAERSLRGRLGHG